MCVSLSCNKHEPCLLSCNLSHVILKKMSCTQHKQITRASLKLAQIRRAISVSHTSTKCGPRYNS